MRQQGARERSFRMLNVASSGQQLEEIIQQYPSTPAAQIAMLALAKAQYDSGSYDLASKTYAQFEKQYPKHYMVPSAKLGRIYCLEAIGLTEEALAQYTAFAAQTNQYLRPLAVFGEARCMRQLGRLADAKALYEDFIAANPKSRWLPQAEDLLATVSRDMRRAPLVSGPRA
jgi:outer membrane protein assembly factor BamD (BamD/ComL family)